MKIKVRFKELVSGQLKSILAQFKECFKSYINRFIKTLIFYIILMSIIFGYGCYINESNKVITDNIKTCFLLLIFSCIFLALSEWLYAINKQISYKNIDSYFELKNIPVENYEEILKKKSVTELLSILKEYNHTRWTSGSIIKKNVISIIIPIAVSTFFYKTIALSFIEKISQHYLKIFVFIILLFPMLVYIIEYIIELFYGFYLSYNDSMEKEIEVKIIKKIINERIGIQLK